MTIQLNERQESFVDSQIKSGRFKSSDEVVTVAFRLLEQLQDEYAEWIEETREKVQSAMAQMERGESLDGETYVQGLLERLEQAKESM